MLFNEDFHGFHNVNFILHSVIMASLSDIVVVVCHGGFLTPEPYIPFIEVLRTKGIETSCPQLPTSDLARLNVGDVNNPDFNREPPEGGYPQGRLASQFGKQDVIYRESVLKVS